ncbi:hypothetical protein [Nitrosomonas ureae]|uniref:hypothetical protein n=1 Tax=Nitrosomonas ureae TaxID=44577 RepID=UPI0020D1068D|nr:hypothetical protein [Nitrosomonas ureae]
MAITLNHTIVPCFDKVASAKFYSRVFGFEYVGVFSHFIVVRVNDTLSLDFDNQERFMPLHYAKYPNRNLTPYLCGCRLSTFPTAVARALRTT